MPDFATYRDRYLPQMRMERDAGGVLLATLFARDGGPFRGDVHHPDFGDYTYAFADIGSDPRNEVVILHVPFAERHSGGDASRAAQRDQYGLVAYAQNKPPLERVTDWYGTAYHGTHYLFNLMDVQVPIIGVVSGHATLHAEVALLSDIVLSAEDAIFREAHYHGGFVPGDGVQIVWPIFIGMNRARHALLTGKVFTAQEALDIGFVHEVWPKDKLLGRAREIAQGLLNKSPITRRYARMALTQEIKMKLRELLHYGLVMEGVGTYDREFRREGKR